MTPSIEQRRAVIEVLTDQPGSTITEMKQRPEIQQAFNNGIARYLASMSANNYLYWHPGGDGRNGARHYYVRPPGWRCWSCEQSRDRNPSRHDISICTYCARGNKHRIKAVCNSRSNTIENCWRNEMMADWSHVPLITGGLVAMPPSRYAVQSREVTL